MSNKIKWCGDDIFYPKGQRSTSLCSRIRTTKLKIKSSNQKFASRGFTICTWNDTDPPLGWGTTPINGQNGRNLRKNSLLCPFLKRASVLWVQSSFLLIWTPRYLYESTLFTYSPWMTARTGGPPVPLVVHHKPICFADIELQVIAVAPCDEALYQSSVLLWRNSL